MLTLVLGRAGTGKTKYAMDDFRRRMEGGESGLLFIVPEQYSHDAEKKLCEACGDKLSLHGEVMSFTGLCRHVLTETGGIAEFAPDAGGRVLAMYRALAAAAPELRVYNTRGIRTQLLEKLLEAINELKSCNITPDVLEQLARSASRPLSDKLGDLGLILRAYDSILRTHGRDMPDRMTALADAIGESTAGSGGHIYFDGFNDFTGQEIRVIGELLKKDADISVCLTCEAGVIRDKESADGAGAILEEAEAPAHLEISSKTAARLHKLAVSHGRRAIVVSPGENAAMRPYDAATHAGAAVGETDKAPELLFLERHLFSDEQARFPGKCEAVAIYRAPSVYAECECAASAALDYVRSGHRWREVGVMARDFDEYGPICESVFEKYGIPFFTSGRADIAGKPPVALIDAALETVTAGWEYKQMFRYLKTGLAGEDPARYAELENYVIKWNIRGAKWNREWKSPPGGYGGAADEAALGRINALRSSIAAPLVRLRDGVKGTGPAIGKLRALCAFLEEIGFERQIEKKAAALDNRGEYRLSGEYAQLRDAIYAAMEQMSAIVGDAPQSAAEFRKILMLTLSQYDIGVIPVSLDRTTLGSMAMSRRRDLKFLIVLGATSDKMPMPVKNKGALTDGERAELVRLGAVMPAGPEERLVRELNMIYSTVTLPSRKLIVSYAWGAGRRPSFIIKRIMELFGIGETAPAEEDYMSAARTPCLELAALAGNASSGPMAFAAREYFLNACPETGRIFEVADALSSPDRGKLSAGVAESLYTASPLLSATRVDNYYACPYRFFLGTGLKLEPRAPAEFDAPVAGIFMHHVLESVFREIAAAPPADISDPGYIRELTARNVEGFAQKYLRGLEDENERLKYLFRRQGEYAARVVLDTYNELERSEFKPLDFELDLSTLAGEAGQLRGVIDRVDGWKQGDKLWLRIVDYKTGGKTLELSDIVYGRNMQMLIYLFAMQRHAPARYGAEIEPAGALYVPALDVIVKAPRGTPEEKLQKMRENALRRSGVVLSEADVLEAMESGEKKYLPVKETKDGALAGAGLVDRAQMGGLRNHVDRMLRGAASGILEGNIGCDPYYRSADDNACRYCEYGSVCRFDVDGGDRPRYSPKLKPDEIWRIIPRSRGLLPRAPGGEGACDE